MAGYSIPSMGAAVGQGYIPSAQVYPETLSQASSPPSLNAAWQRIEKVSNYLADCTARLRNLADQLLPEAEKPTNGPTPAPSIPGAVGMALTLADTLNGQVAYLDGLIERLYRANGV